ncbi:MAG TPA: hypothetical protein HPP97_11195 [Desulfuromonadales bacterium]|nr:hypothetical protein [Desulfuromonadales bacterium]
MKKMISSGLVAASLLVATSSWAALPAFIQGYVKNAQGVGVAGATVKCNYSTVKSLPNGAFITVQPGGSFTCTAQYAGSQASVSGYASSGSSTLVIIKLP